MSLPVGVGADADAAVVGGPRLPPEAVGLGVLVTVGVGDRQDVPEGQDTNSSRYKYAYISKQGIF